VGNRFVLNQFKMMIKEEHTTLKNVAYVFSMSILVIAGAVHEFGAVHELCPFNFCCQ